MKLKRGDKVQIVTGVTEFRDVIYYDIRTHVLLSKGKDAGKFVPTRKGVSVPLDKAKRFLEYALQEVEEALEAQAPTKKTRKVSK